MFAFIGRADPDPKGFAWLATLIGLFETGYITSTGLLRPRRARTQHPGAGHARARRRRDPARQGRLRALRHRPVRRRLPRARRPPGRRGPRDRSACRRSRRARSRVARPALVRSDGMSETQRQARRASAGEATREPELQPDDHVRCDDPGDDGRRAARGSGTATRRQADIMGYMGIRILADRETPGEYVIVADFGVVDPDVSAADEAARNNERPETQEWARAPARAHRRRARVPPLRRALPHRPAALSSRTTRAVPA